MQCIVIIVLKIEPAGQVRYNKQQLNSQRRAKHVRNTIEMKSYPSLNSDTGCSNGWSSICDLFVAWALDVRDLLFLHSYIGRTPFSYPRVLCKKVRPIRAKIRYADLNSKGCFPRMNVRFKVIYSLCNICSYLNVNFIERGTLLGI